MHLETVLEGVRFRRDGDLGEREHPSGRLPIDIPMLVGLHLDGRLELDALVSRTYPLEEINEAIAAVNRGEARRNVIVFDDADRTGDL